MSGYKITDTCHLHGHTRAVGLACPYCLTDEQAQCIEELERENKELRDAVQAAFDCGMIPTSTDNGGASSYSAQVKAADMLRAALLEGDNE